MDTASLLILSLLLQAPPAPRQASDAGSCARCHISITVEWSVSAHKSAGVGCVPCHGASEGHVAEERNHVKPERIPRGAAVAGLCLDCHTAGCPKTRRRDACQTCHHVHALVDLTRPPQTGPAKDDQAAAAWRAYEQSMKAGEAEAAREGWNEALAHFAAAARLRPGDARAAARSAFCRRRLAPARPGFRILTQRYDPLTGLPAEVEVEPLGMRMLAVAGGSFDMGDAVLEDSRPVHTVRVEPFYLGQYEVTQEQWQKVMGSNPSFHKDPQLPVESVSWNDCREFIARLNRMVPGGGFRLPTEAEWEFAARAGGPAPEERAWHRENSRIKPGDRADFTDLAPRAAGSGRPGAAGFHDLLGNVWEWCSSLYRPFLYDPRDGREDPAHAGLRVLRGGSYADGADLLQPALRHADRPDRRFRWNGLRVARGIL